MPSNNQMNLDARAGALLDQLKAGMSGISASVFDAAWMSTIVTEDLAVIEPDWAFPECFQYVLRTQQLDGGWESYDSPEDGLLNTSAALIALTYHQTDGKLNEQHWRARKALQSRLDSCGDFRFAGPGKSGLLSTMLRILQSSRVLLRAPKSLLGVPSDLTGIAWQQRSVINPHQTVGQIGLEDGVTGVSPGLLAARIAYTLESNTTLEKVLKETYSIGDRGGVPALCPDDRFELSTVLEILLEHFPGIEPTIVDMLQDVQPRLELDDASSASFVSSESYIHGDAHLKMMIALQRSNAGLNTAEVESVTTGSSCLQLKLLIKTSVTAHSSVARIQSLVTQICDTWFAANETVNRATTNSSPYYASMLMTNAFIDVITAWEDGRLPDLFASLIRDRVAVALCQCLIGVLHFQNPDGSWGFRGSAEETSYALLTLISLSSLPFLRPLSEDIEESQQRGRTVLRRLYLTGAHRCPSYLWKSTVSFSSTLVAEAYVLAALKAEPRVFDDQGSLMKLFDIPMERLQGLEDFYASLSMFQDQPRRIIRASLIEGYLFRPTLLSPQLYLYADKDSSRWLEYITFVFPACKNAKGVFVPSNILLALMGVMSGLYQIDSFIEHAIEKGLVHNVRDLYRIINDAFDNKEGDTHSEAEQSPSMGCLPQDSKPAAETPSLDAKEASVGAHGLHSPPDSPPRGSDAATVDDLSEAKSVLKRLVNHIMQHPAVGKASSNDRHWLWTELRAFFYAQAAQIEEKGIFLEQRRARASHSQGNPCFDSPYATYYRWLHSTGADSVGSPYQFAFFSILLANEAGNASGSVSLGDDPSQCSPRRVQDCWTSAREKLLAQSMSAGVARMWRIENDVGGIVRDRADGTVNSVNFSDFTSAAYDDAGLSEQLLALAGRERRAWKADYAELEELARGDEWQEKKVRMVKLFTSAMELYGQIYIARDVWWKKADD